MEISEERLPIVAVKVLTYVAVPIISLNSFIIELRSLCLLLSVSSFFSIKELEHYNGKVAQM